MADLRWNSVNANFNDVNSAMGNSISGISQAGTIFGDLRKSILDEEQRAVDNAFREKQFDEQVSQFAATHGLNEEQLREQIRHSQESERLTGEGHEVQKRGQNLYHKAAMAGVDAQNRGTALKEQMYDDEQNRSAILTEVTRDVLAPSQALKKEKADLITANNSGTLTDDALATNKARLAQIEGIIRTDHSASDLDNNITNETLMRGGGLVPATSMSKEAAAEQARALVTTKRNAPMTDKEYAESQIKANTLISKGKYTGQQSELLMGALRAAQNKYKDIAPEALASTILAVTGDAYNAWFDWSGSKAFSADDKVVEEFTKNPTNPNNPIAQAISGLVKTGLSNPNSGTGDDKQGDGGDDDDDEDVDITTLTPRALAYREQQMLKSLPTVESITKDTPEVQARSEQLYRARYTNMPRSEVPASERETLKKAALQGAKNTIQQMRTNVTSQTKSELKRRRNQDILNSRFPYAFPK